MWRKLYRMNHRKIKTWKIGKLRDVIDRMRTARMNLIGIQEGENGMRKK